MTTNFMPDGASQNSRRDHAVRIYHELLRGAVIEILVALGGLVERDRLHVHGFRDLDLVVEDALHEVAIVFLHGALAGGEAVALGPAQANADAEHADLGVGVHAAGVAGDVEAGDAERAAGASD